MGKVRIKLALEGGVRSHFPVKGLKVRQGRHQGLGHKFATVGAKAALGVGYGCKQLGADHIGHDTTTSAAVLAARMN